MKNPFRTLQRKYRRFRGRKFFNKFRRMFTQFDKRLKKAEFTRHERRRLRKLMVQDIKYASKILDLIDK